MRTSSSLCSSAASHPSSHTVSGKYCYFITFVLPSLRSGTRDVRTSSSLCSSAGTLRRIPQAVSTVASSPLFSLPFSQGLEMCGPHRRFAPLLSRTLRRIPQAVGTVATGSILYAAIRPSHRKVSIPQAVRSAVAITLSPTYRFLIFISFNTASGKKRCCN